MHLEEIVSFQKTNHNINKFLNERIIDFGDVDRNNIDFIQTFFEIFNDNPILKSLLKENINIQNKNIAFDVLVETMKATLNEYKRIGQHMRDGTLSFEKFDSLIKAHKNWKDSIRKLMNLMEANEKLCNERFHQIEIYQKLNNINKILDMLMEIKEKNQLTGDFEFLENIHTSVKIF